MKSLIEIYQDGKWVPAAEIAHKEGHQATFEYLPTYQFRDNPAPISLTLPINTGRIGYEDDQSSCPSFIFDLVPQGLGRKYLLQNLNKPDGDGMDIPLAQLGAFNPIGNLRLDTAVKYFEEWRDNNAINTTEGFTEAQIVSRQEAFVNHIWLHAMLTAGTTGVQGAAPKFLLTQNIEGIWFADSALPDNEAVNHWLIKLPRGRTQADLDVLRIEAIYHAIAKDCGIRAEGQCYLKNDMLFFERFDRKVVQANTVRIHQESLTSIAGISGFPGGISLFKFVDAIAKHATNPALEITEFIKRELLNRAMGNTDNHGRNSAMQITQEGLVQLAPLYDFAPMFMDPEMIPRNCRWVVEKKELQTIEEIISNINTTEQVKHEVLNRVINFYDVLGGLEDLMTKHELDKNVIERLHYNIKGAMGMIRG